MIKIVSEKSFDNLHLEDNVKAFLLCHLRKFLQEYGCTSIAEFGSIDYLESTEDVLTYNGCGLSETLQRGFEWIDIANLSDGQIMYTISVVHSTDYGVNIIGLSDILGSEMHSIIENEKER